MILVVPCFNEGQRFDSAKWLSDDAQKFTHLVFVNDGSTDDTLKVLNRLKKSLDNDGYTNVTILSLTTNMGKAGAVRAGMLYARDLPYMDNDRLLLAYCDADLSTPLVEMLRLGKVLNDQQPDVVLGTRVKLLGLDIRNSSVRHFLGRISALLINAVLKLGVYDTQAGAKVFRAGYVTILFEKPFISRWLFDCELIFRVKEHELSLLEEPLQVWVNHHAGSRIRLCSYLRSLIDLIKIRFEYRSIKKNKPSIDKS